MRKNKLLKNYEKLIRWINGEDSCSNPRVPRGDDTRRTGRNRGEANIRIPVRISAGWNPDTRRPT